MTNLLTQGLDFQAQALSLRSQRQRLIASNIANADTPGYVARDMDFAQALRSATGLAGQGGSLVAATAQGGASNAHAGSSMAHAKHFALPSMPTAAGGVDDLLYASNSQTNLDQNTVDMDRERASFADNSVKYEATLRFINSSVRTMLDAMKSHNQG